VNWVIAGAAQLCNRVLTKHNGLAQYLCEIPVTCSGSSRLARGVLTFAQYAIATETWDRAPCWSSAPALRSLRLRRQFQNCAHA
jgi:hypothetical protein